MGAFDQIVAEQRFGGKPVCQDRVERAHVVDGLAVKDGVEKQSCCASETVWQ